MKKTFDELLSENHLGFTGLLSSHEADDLRSFWDTLVMDNDGVVSDAEIDSLLSTYQQMGVIAPLSAEDIVEANEMRANALEQFLKKERAAKKKDEKKDEESVPIEPTVPKTQDGVTHGSTDPDFFGQLPSDPVQGKPVITYELMISDARTATDEHPILILADPDHSIPHHQMGDFTNPERRTAFEFRVSETEVETRDILFLDKRFVKLLSWLGEGHIAVKLSGHPVDAGYAVYKIRAVDPNGNESLTSTNDGFLQLILRRLQASLPPEDVDDDSEHPEDTDETLILSDMPSMIDFMKTAGDTLPPNIRSWAHRNIAMTKANTISQEEKRHAQRALSIMLHIQWESPLFPSIDPKQARRILDEELYGLETVKQRVIETIIQINRTHTLPSYGLLLVGPAGTGKSQIAYAGARILKLPWTSLDMSTIHDPEALTGTPRVYANAKPGRIMEAFSNAGASNLVFIINELDKSDKGNAGSNPADALLTLLDGLGFTDNYVECTIPTGGVYPIATANDKSRISDPLLTRFAVIDIPDYTPDEKKIIFTDYSMPRVLRRLGMKRDECMVTPDAVDQIIECYRDVPGVRDLEQAAEHLAANALYQIETGGKTSVTFDREAVQQTLGR